ncbi:hypothetical protein BDZ91DRAFT_801122 [Kalaharituber pfeilii]|nr:hypothetical protein BDZ91DRAFT_801122 [Kalaharituber pfeilii]
MAAAKFTAVTLPAETATSYPTLPVLTTNIPRYSMPTEAKKAKEVTKAFVPFVARAHIRSSEGHRLTRLEPTQVTRTPSMTIPPEDPQVASSHLSRILALANRSAAVTTAHVGLRSARFAATAGTAAAAGFLKPFNFRVMFGLETAGTSTVIHENEGEQFNIEYYERECEHDTENTEFPMKNEETKFTCESQSQKPITYELVKVQNSEIKDTVNNTLIPVDSDLSASTYGLDNMVENNVTTIVTPFQNKASASLYEVSSYGESITSSEAEIKSSAGFSSCSEYSSEAIEEASPAFSGFISKIPRPCQSQMASTSTVVIHSRVTSFYDQQTAKPSFVSMIPTPVKRVESGYYAASSTKAEEAKAASHERGIAARRSMIPRPVKGNENVDFEGMSARTVSARYIQGCKIPRKISMNVVRE